MSNITLLLSALLGVGGVGGLVALLRLRADKGAVVMDTVSKGVLVLERLNALLEQDLLDERRARQLAEVRVDALEAALRAAGLPIPKP